MEGLQKGRPQRFDRERHKLNAGKPWAIEISANHTHLCISGVRPILQGCRLVWLTSIDPVSQGKSLLSLGLDR